MSATVLSREQRAAWNRDGYLVIERFAEPILLDALTESIVAMARASDRGEDIGDAYVVAEKAFVAEGIAPEDRLSKIFRVHRHVEVFRNLAVDPRLLDLVEALLGTPEIDCFLSQFIFKVPGALGQPWHQDAFYFPFDRGPQIGAWLAVTKTTLDNGPLWILPGSHREGVHDVVPDRREHANHAYVEIVDHDMSAAVPALLEAGDLLLFHSNLMHRSTDNVSQRRRAAMVYHYGEAGTVDRSAEKWGFVPRNVDWMPARRAR
jgi:ectoine hydroxylase-related dioxygenase (phytanoyl-CoA dioxygenase family)